MLTVESIHFRVTRNVMLRPHQKTLPMGNPVVSGTSGKSDPRSVSRKVLHTSRRVINEFHF